MKLNTLQIADFRNVVWKYYLDNKRPMPWRDDTRPYYVLLSEIMLQQTQVNRVIEKFKQFTEQYPTVVDLAHASLAEVLSLWSGLGYNRRAKFLKQCAEVIVDKHKGHIPDAKEALVALPGIGPATASAVLTYAFNHYSPYIETNVRTVYMHHFYHDCDAVSDKEILALVEQCHDSENPREWCWAVMDYGTYLKKTVGNLNRKSKHYKKQSKFEGSYRQKRGEVLRRLLSDHNTSKVLAEQTGYSAELTKQLLDDLQSEGFVAEENGVYKIVSK